MTDPAPPPPDRHRAGSALTDRLLAAVMPVLDGQDSELACEAMAAAMIVVLQVAGTDAAGQALFVRRYKAALDSYVR